MSRLLKGPWASRPRLQSASDALNCASLAVLWLLSACDRSPLPPNQPGVCWRADFRSLKEPSFTVAATDAPNIVSCAADLELAYLTEKQSITGAYQGYYIFVGPVAVTAAQRLNFIRYPVLNKAERAMIDTRLREFIAARAEAAKAPPHA